MVGESKVDGSERGSIQRLTGEGQQLAMITLRSLARLRKGRQERALGGRGHLHGSVQ